MRRKGNSVIIPLVIAVVAIAMLSRGGGIGLLNINHSMLLRNPPQGISTVITSPRGRNWNIERQIRWPQYPPTYQPQYPCQPNGP